MKILYYSDAYHSVSGSRTHAREFVAAVRQEPGVSAVDVFPPANGENVPGGSGRRQRRSGRLPYQWRHFVRCVLKPRGFRYDRLARCLRGADYDWLIMRPELDIRLIPRIKRDFPSLGLCVEVNAALFDETLRGIPGRRFWQLWEARLLERADRILVVSTALKEYLGSRGVRTGKIGVNCNGVNPDRFQVASGDASNEIRNRFGIPVDAFLLGYVGGMEPFRRLRELVEHVADVRRSGLKDLFLLLAGDGRDMPRVRRAIKERAADLGGWVSCEGSRPYDEVPSIVASLDLALFPFSNRYGCPQKLFEYLAMARPTLGPDVPAVREVFEPGVHLRVARQDGSDVQAAITEMREHVEVFQQQAQAGQRHVLSHYTWRQNAQRALALLGAEAGR